MSGLRRQTALLALLAVVSACVGITSDQVPSIGFKDRTYFASAPVGMRFDADDLVPIGVAQEVRADVLGNEVFRLDGVDLQLVVVMRSGPGSEYEYTLFIAEGALPQPSDRVSENSASSLASIPGMCRYLVPLPAGC